MNIGMVLDGSFPPDFRVEKEAKILLRNHRVFLLSTENNKGETEREYNGIAVKYAISKYPDPFRSLIDKIKKEKGGRSLLEKKIENFVDKYKIDVIHAHDLPTAFVALKVACSRKLPLVADLHENYPYYKGENKRCFRYWIEIERTVVQNASFCLATVEEMKERLVRKHNIPSGKIFVVRNVYGGEFESASLDEEIVKKYSDRFTILYNGIIRARKGCRVLIESLKYLREFPDIFLCLVGAKENGKNENELKQFAKRLELEKKVEFVNWQPMEKLYSFIKASSVCTVPFKKNTQTDCASPHKLFQYMACGKPVIVSDCNSIERVVQESGCGLVFKSENASDLAEKIVRLYRDSGLRDTLGDNGRKATEKKYNFETDGRQLISLYQMVAK